MNIPHAGDELHEAEGAGKRGSSMNKACVPCRARKVKCDAAVVGLPCSSCRSRQCVADCVPLVRKSRMRKGTHIALSSGQTRSGPTTSKPRNSEILAASENPECQSPGQTEPDLLYLHILNDAVDETSRSAEFRATSTTPHCPTLDQSFTPRNCQSTSLSHLDNIDRDYLTKKGIFDLPAPQHLDALVKTYFDQVNPVTPVIHRPDFVRRYRGGDCSLLLLRTMLAAASIQAPADVLTACGFADRSAAQESLFSAARLLYDFADQEDPVILLQASIVLCNVILDHPTDRDFSYWFLNAIRLAKKLNLGDLASESDRSHEGRKLYRSIWWALYCLDIFHVFINPKRSCLLGDCSNIKFISEDDWEDEYNLGGSSGSRSTVALQQRISPVAVCEMSRIFGECLSVVKSRPQQDPREMLHSLDSWRKSLASKMHTQDDVGIDTQYLNVKALSYRYECILCRYIRQTCQHSGRADWTEWVRQRFRSAVLELDTIVLRILAVGTLEACPITLITTITALLALHIESALDSKETDLIRSMSRLSISQTMLLLTQGEEIPALKRALPIFERILVKSNLYCLAPDRHGHTIRRTIRRGGIPTYDMLTHYSQEVPAQPQPLHTPVVEAHNSPRTQLDETLSHFDYWENNESIDTNFLGFDLSDEWPRTGQLDFSG